MTASSSRSSTEMLVVSTSKECSLLGCHEHDFLPITCPGCHLPFCLSHHSPYLLSSSSTYHPCPSPPPDRTPLPCPLCETPISTAAGLDPNAAMDRHLGGPACSEAAARRGMPLDQREREERRARRRKGELCWDRRCRKMTKGGLGVRCEQCTHVFCLPHRTPSSHSCSPPPSRTSTPAAGPRKVPLSLSSAPTAAGLAALRRQQHQQSSASASSKPTLITAATKVEPKPLTAAEKNAQSEGGLKPVSNPFKGAGQKVVTSRCLMWRFNSFLRSKAEQASRLKALAHRAKLGLLSEDEKLEWAVMCAEGHASSASGKVGSAGAGTKGKGKKDGCVVC